jgi:hypothetical protein
MDTIQDNIPIEIFVSDISDTENYKPVEKPIEKPIEKPKRRKYKTEDTSWRRRPDGTYNKAPLDPDYYKKYMAEPIKCPLCSVLTSRGHLSRHTRSAICSRINQILLDRELNSS